MQAIDAGPLSSARILEAMGTLDTFLNMQGGSWQTAWKLLEPWRLNGSRRPELLAG